MTAPELGAEPGFGDRVFVNCPFDEKYKSLLHATLFAIHDCGFIASHALQEVGGKESRLEKILRLIENAQWSIHDVSRVELSRATRLPRFNMPFECGLAFGAMRFSALTGRDALVMTGVQFQDKAAISDLAGIDPEYHSNEVADLIAKVRKFLYSKVAFPKARVRGHTDIHQRLLAYQNELPQVLKSERITAREIVSFDYINDWLRVASIWIAANQL
jgi:hypothetical protein